MHSRNPIHTIIGSPTCERITYVTLVNGEVFKSDDIRQVLCARHEAGAAIDVNHTAISHLLHDGLVPPPLTVYQDIFAISVDLTARASASNISFARDYPFENRKSPQTGHPSTTTLLHHLARATRLATAGTNDVILMLSAGVDSTSVALAAKEAGRDDVLCVTYGESESDFEVEFARATCRRLGLNHTPHVITDHDRSLESRLLNYASKVPEPCADPALVACISLVARHAAQEGIVLDGSGNDYYFWRPPRRIDLFKTWLGLGRIRAFRELRKLIPMYYPHERLLASPLELLLLHGAWLRYSESRRFYPKAVDSHRYWVGESRHCYQFDREELQHCLKMIYMGPAAFMLKTRNASLPVGAHPRFPWTDNELADYCFSLPATVRFDRKHRKSKTIIRQMLQDTISYDADKVGKRPFSFGKRNFLQRHLAFCRDQILACSLWSPRIAFTFDRLADLMTRGQQTENALLAMLMVSLWHNHWIQGGMLDLLHSNRERQAALDNVKPTRRANKA